MIIFPDNISIRLTYQSSVSILPHFGWGLGT